MECNLSNNHNESRGEVKIENQELPKSEHFRYLGSIITTTGEIGVGVVHKIKADLILRIHHISYQLALIDHRPLVIPRLLAGYNTKLIEAGLDCDIPLIIIFA
ncbi:hypothetical protein CsSME_00006805 [Camellia sinensis var. sinensis]